MTRTTTDDRLLTRPAVERRVGLGHTSIYDRVKRGTFPAPFKIGAKAVRWSEREIEEWVGALPRTRCDRAA